MVLRPLQRFASFTNYHWPYHVNVNLWLSITTAPRQDASGSARQSMVGTVITDHPEAREMSGDPPVET